MVGGTAFGCARPNPTSGWINDKQWGSIIELSERIPCYKGFDVDFENNIDKWEIIYQSVDPHMID